MPRLIPTENNCLNFENVKIFSIQAAKFVLQIQAFFFKYIDGILKNHLNSLNYLILILVKKVSDFFFLPVSVIIL